MPICPFLRLRSADASQLDLSRDFIERRYAIAQFLQGALAETPTHLGSCFLPQRLVAGPGNEQFLDLGVDLHHFEEADAPAVSGAIASRAAFSGERGHLPRFLLR